MNGVNSGQPPVEAAMVLGVYIYSEVQPSCSGYNGFCCHSNRNL